MSVGPERQVSLKRCAPFWVGLGALAVAFLLAWGLSPDGPEPMAKPAKGSGRPATVGIAGITVDRGDSEELAAARPLEERIGAGSVARAEDYRSQARRIFLAGLLLGLLALGFLAFYRGPPVGFLLARAGRWPFPGAAAVGFSLALVLAIVRLPFSLAGYDLGREYGLVTQGRADWFVDLATSTGITALLAAIGAMVAVALWRRMGRRFWLAGSALLAVWAVVLVWLWPVVVSPMFNRFDRLPDGPTRAEVERLAGRAGVGIGDVYEVDASRRSSTLNAYVNGIGPSKRVVIYDNAIRKLSPAEMSALIAHELGHVKSNDLYRGLVFAILVIPLAVLFVQLTTSAAVRRSGDDPDGPGIVPALALMSALVALVLSVPGNMLSRSIESRADRYALELTSEPGGLISLQVQLAWANLSDPDPPGPYEFLFGTHPSTRARIVAAEDWGQPENRAAGRLSTDGGEAPDATDHGGDGS
ncbi:MAG: M48 family metallopeptidase [Thermoleophilia bacterium]|nr:M48 family metallopeptidase [Thermoleophilia bacterium]